MKKIIDKGFNKAVLMELREYKGKKFLQLMELWRADEKEEWKFSKKNITINSNTISDFIDFIIENGEELKKEIGENKKIKKSEKTEDSDDSEEFDNL
jgi:hypothetical protein